MPRLKSKKGQGLVEYILAVALIAVMVIGGIRVFGKKTHNAFVNAADTLDTETNMAAIQGMSEKEIKTQ